MAGDCGQGNFSQGKSGQCGTRCASAFERSTGLTAGSVESRAWQPAAWRLILLRLQSTDLFDRRDSSARLLHITNASGRAFLHVCFSILGTYESIDKVVYMSKFRNGRVAGKLSSTSTVSNLEQGCFGAPTKETLSSRGPPIKTLGTPPPQQLRGMSSITPGVRSTKIWSGRRRAPKVPMTSAERVWPPAQSLHAYVRG